MKTVAIVYGWAEGAWQGKKFARELSRQGFEIIQDIRNADIIVAHSAGCYLIPKKPRARTIILIGLPHWPRRTLASGIIRKLISEVSYHRRNEGLGWWLDKMLHNVWYIVSRPQKTYYSLSRHSLDNLPQKIKGKNKILLVRASDDTLLHPESAMHVAAARGYDFIEMPGAHDDCWLKPKPYIDLLLKEL